MNTYKITNRTNLFGKRSAHFNIDINIDYIDNRTKKVITLKPNETVYLTVQSLPLSVRKMVMKNMIDVSDVKLESVLKKPKTIVKSKKKISVKKDVTEIKDKETSTKTKKKTASEKKETNTK